MSYGTDTYDEDRWGARFVVCLDDASHGRMSYERILDDHDDEAHQATTQTQAETISIGAVPFIKTMWALLWTAFFHPFTNTVIDMTTGDIVETEYAKWKR